MKLFYLPVTVVFMIILANCHQVIADSSDILTKKIDDKEQNIDTQTLQKDAQLSLKYFRILQNQQLEPKIQLEKYDGGELELKSLRDNLVILCMFATWCTSCQEHVAQLSKLQSYLEFNDINDVQISLISIDFKSKDEVMKYLKSNKAENLAIYFDHRKSLMHALGAQNVPTTYIFDKKGFLISVVQSKMRWADNEVVQELLKIRDMPRSSSIGAVHENTGGLMFSKESPAKGVMVIN